MDMAATFVTVAELRANLGIGSLYSDPIVEEVCMSAEDLIQSQLWYNRAPVVATGLQNNVATIVIANPGLFVTGQSVVISASGPLITAHAPLLAWGLTLLPMAVNG